MTLRRGFTSAVLAAIALWAACAPAAEPQKPASAWPAVPDPATLPPGAWKDTVLYGKTLVSDTASVLGPEAADPKMRYAGNNLACQNCHLAGGTQRFGLPLIGVYGAFPTFMGRENDVRTLEDRVNG